MALPVGFNGSPFSFFSGESDTLPKRETSDKVVFIAEHRIRQIQSQLFSYSLLLVELTSEDRQAYDKTELAQFEAH